MVTKRLSSFNSLEEQIEVFSISKQLYDGLFQVKMRLHLKYFDKIYLFVEKFTVHIMLASYKQGITWYKDNHVHVIHGSMEHNQWAM